MKGYCIPYDENKVSENIRKEIQELVIQFNLDTKMLLFHINKDNNLVHLQQAYENKRNY